MVINFIPEGKTDEELVQLTLKNKEFFSYLVNRYSIKLSRYIIRISGLGREDADDLLQDIFIKAYKNLNNFDRRLKFSSWIYRIAHNQVIDNFRRRRVRPGQIYWEDNGNILVKLLADDDVIQRIDSQIDRRKIYQAIERLDYKYKEVLELRFLEERNYQEISDILKKPVGTIASLINRAKLKLSEQLNKS
ncbi:MAG TPA: RNA polymerase sigma factor [bacterium]|nr:RNA polymerase sigma factor [bacterium]HNP75525.1 RNA polymerase sigma factor [bacterium]HNS33607.1 RNA polymerase sigma factor [bacterium]HNW09717.1 RNA polymerase sigma factor [bacterium]HNZ73738.1 RNA polymerase sigma factor [bacterium]